MKICNSQKLNNLIQILILALLPLIDLYRTVGASEQTMMATQAIGLVIAGVLITHYQIKEFFKLYNLIWGILCAIGIFTIHSIYSRLTSAILYERECWIICINVCLYGMIYTYLIKKSIKEKNNIKEILKNCISVRNLPVLFWLVYEICAICAKEIIYRPFFETAYFLPFFVVVFSGDERKRLYENFTNGILIGFWALQAIAFLRRPWVDNMSQYPGMYTNSNLYDIMCMLVLFLLLLRMTKVRRVKGIKCIQYWFYLLQYGMIFSFIMLSVGRMTIIFTIVGTAIYLLMMLLVVERVKVKQFILSAASIILAIIIMFPVTVASVSYFPRILKRPISYGMEYEKWGDLNNKDNYVSIDEFAEMFIGRAVALLKGEQTDTESNTTAESAPEVVYENVASDKKYFLEDENYSAIELRVAIGLTFFSELNMQGHTTDEWCLWVSPTEQFIHAHNIFIMLAFIYGIPAGIFFILWMLSGIVYGIRYSRKQRDVYMFFPVVIILVVISFGCFEMNWQPGTLSWFALLFATKYVSLESDAP